MPQRTPGGTARPPSPAPGSGTHSDDSGDEFLAALLIRMWALASGRTLRRDVPPDQLSPEELIAFWADDMTPQAGRHARPGAPDLTADAYPTVTTARQAPQPHRKSRRVPSSGRTARNRQERSANPAAA
jgi:hypothetical protein